MEGLGRGVREGGRAVSTHWRLLDFLMQPARVGGEVLSGVQVAWSSGGGLEMQPYTASPRELVSRNPRLEGDSPGQLSWEVWVMESGGSRE